MTEDQLDHMTPRTFHNLIKGRVKKEKADRKREDLKHQETILALLTPHMKKPDRDRAYNDLYSKVGEVKPKSKKKMTPEEVKAFLEQHKKK